MDKYDEQIQRLLADPVLLEGEWCDGEGIFALCGDRNKIDYLGCLTMIRRTRDKIDRPWVAATPELTLAIRQDERIPETHKEILPEHFPVFAEWQRKIDLMEVR